MTRRIFALLALASMVLSPSPAAAQKISALPSASALGNADVAPVVQGGTTKKATSTQLQGVAAQTAVAVAHTGDTVETTTDTVAIAGGTLGANGRIEVHADFTYPNSANVKTFRIKLGGTTLWNGGPTTTTHLQVKIVITNRGAQNSQRWSAQHVLSSGSVGDTSGTAAIDTSAAQNVTITEQLAVGTETVTREAMQVVIYPKS